MKSIIVTAFVMTGLVSAERTTVFVGTQARGIYALQLDETTGALSDPKMAAVGPGMEFQALSEDGKRLVSTRRMPKGGGVVAFAVDGMELRETSSRGYPGRGLCHVSLDADDKVIFGADYGGGKVVSFSLKGGEIGEVVSVMQHEGSSVNKKRQEGPHAHSIYAGPGNQFAYAPDLGIDQVKFYRFDEAGRLTDEGGFLLPAGAGPRHMEFGKNGQFAYVLNELSLTVSVFGRDQESGKLTMKGTVSVFADGVAKEKMTCSEIRVSKDGRFLYTANRDLKKEGRDSLSVLAIAEDGMLKHVQTAPAKVWIPRNINLSPSGKWLLVAGQRSDSVTSHRIDPQTGQLSFSGESAEVQGPMCITFGR